jgi:hypothetical protein
MIKVTRLLPKVKEIFIALQDDRFWKKGCKSGQNRSGPDFVNDFIAPLGRFNRRSCNPFFD